jgi:hypothetical protein
MIRTTRREDPEFYREIYKDLVKNGYMTKVDLVKAFNVDITHINGLMDTFDSVGLLIYEDKIRINKKIRRKAVIKPFFDYVPELEIES